MRYDDCLKIIFNVAELGGQKEKRDNDYGLTACLIIPTRVHPKMAGCLSGL